MKIMYLDESGDHNLVKIERDYPVFVLGGVIVEREYARIVIERELRTFKREFFGREDLILHTADIVRNANGFEELQDASFRQRFFRRLNALMQSLDYQVVACAIHKDRLVARYGRQTIDPYMLSLNVLVERFCFELGDHADNGLIVAERRRPDLDDELEEAWLGLREQGTRFQQASVIDRRIVDLVLKRKRLNVAGLQLADLVVSPIGRHVLGKPEREDWAIVERKLRRLEGDYRGSGLVRIPRQKW